MDLFQCSAILNSSFHSVDSSDRFSFIMSSWDPIFIPMLAKLVSQSFGARADPLSFIMIPHYVIVIVQLSGIYGSKRTESEGGSPRARFVYVAINP